MLWKAEYMWFVWLWTQRDGFRKDGDDILTISFLRYHVENSII